MAKAVQEASPPGPSVVTKKMEQLFHAAKIHAPDNYDISQSQEALKDLLLGCASNKRFHVALAKLNRSLELAEKFIVALTSVVPNPTLGFLTWMSLKLLLEHTSGSVRAFEQAAEWIKQAYGKLPDLRACSDSLRTDSVVLQASLMYTWEASIDFWIMALANLRRTRRTLWLTKELLITSDMLQRMENIKQNNTRLHDKINLIIPPSTLNGSKIQDAIIDLPDPRNTSFCGGKDVLNRMNGFLERPYQSGSTGSPITCMLHGMGGVGKTATALEYAYLNRDKYDSIFWIAADSHSRFLQSYSAMGELVGVVSEAEAVRDWLKTTPKRWLMVFDDVKIWDEGLFRQYLPPTSQTASSIIFTSRTPAQLIPWVNYDVQIQPMVIEEGAMLLSRLLALEDSERTHLYISQPCTSNFRSIVSALGGLPVGIIHASAQINYLQISPQEYLEMLSDNGNVLLTTRPFGIYGHQQSLPQTFLPAIYELPDNELHLISIIALLDADGVPEQFFRGSSSCNCSDCFKFSNRQGFLKALAALNAQNLVRRAGTAEGPRLIIHPLVKMVLLSAITPEKKGKALTCALKLLRDVVPRPPRILQEDASNLANSFQHVLNFSEAFVLHHMSEASVEAVDLFCDAALNMYVCGGLFDSRKLLQTAERFLDGSEGGSDCPSRHHLRAKLDGIFALTLDSIGISGRAEAEKRRNAVFENLSQLFEEPVLAPADIGMILLYGISRSAADIGQQMYQLDKVSEHLLRFYGQDKPWSDRKYSESFIAAMRYFGLSLTSGYQNDLDSSLKYANEAITLTRRDGGNPEMAANSIYGHYWMVFLAQKGQFDDALEAGGQLVDQMMNRFGMLNCNTLNCLLSLGVLRFYAGDPESAVNSLQSVLSHGIGVLPEETIARTQYYLSQALSRLPGHSTQVLELAETARRSMQRLMGLSPNFLEDHFKGNEAVLYDFLVTPSLALWMLNPDRALEESPLTTSCLTHGTFSMSQRTTRYSAPLQLKVLQTASKPYMQVNFTHGKETQSDYVPKTSIQRDATRGSFNNSAETAVGSESWSSSWSVVNTESDDRKVRSENNATTVSPKIIRAVEGTTAQLDPVGELAVAAVDGAAQTASASFSQLQYDLAFGTSVATIVTAAVSYGANGCASLKTANATKRSAIANERVATVQEASLQWQKEEALRKKGKRKSQDDTDESNDEGGNAPDSSSKRPIDPVKSNPLRRSHEVETRSSKTMRQSKNKRKAAINSIEFPSVPTRILSPDFPSAPTSPWATEIQSNDGESKTQDAQKQREAANKLLGTVALTKTTNVQRFEEKCRRENQLSGKLQRRRYESENGYQGATGSFSTAGSRNAAPIVAIDITQLESEEQDIIHEEPLRSEFTSEDVSYQLPPVSQSSVGLSTTSEGSSSTEMPAWDMKPEDLSLKHFSVASRKQVSFSNGSGQGKLLSPSESDTGSKDTSANKSSDECLEQAKVCKSIEGTAMQDLVTKEESCMPPTSTEASEEDHDISAS